ncbi:MAG: Rab family GTPase [Pseudomonadota bacterium]|nr:Rab family GTPase [Pseudomonadota bacterium]
MIDRVFKVCLLGAPGVGKTSLLHRFVNDTFSDTYKTTVGVTIKTKTLATDSGEIKLILWDIEGERELTEMQKQYLKRCHGYLLVADISRFDTFEVLEGYQKALENYTQLPHIVFANKSDLVDEDKTQLTDRIEMSPLVFTSAKTGENVEEGFMNLAAALTARPK